MERRRRKLGSVKSGLDSIAAEPLPQRKALISRHKEVKKESLL
jgi:hypothetical protein